MTYAAYDPDRLRRLRRALDELAADPVLRPVDDPLARPLVATARQAAEVLLAWRPRLDDLLALDPLGPAGTGPTDLAGLDLPECDPGFVLAADVVTPGLDAAVLAARLPAFLAAADLDALLDDPAAAAELAVRLDAVAGNPPVAAALAGSLGLGGVLDLVERVAPRLPGQDPDARAARSIVRALAVGIGRMAATSAAEAGHLLEALLALPPYLAAAVVRDAALPAELLGQVVPELLRRWLADPQAERDGGVPALLADALVPEPALARRLLQELPPADLDPWLGHAGGPAGTAAAARLWRAATDAASGPLAEVQAFVDWLVGVARTRPVLAAGPGGIVVAAALGPWLDHLVPDLEAGAAAIAVLHLAGSQPGAVAVLRADADRLLARDLGAEAAEPAAVLARLAERAAVVDTAALAGDAHASTDTTELRHEALDLTNLGLSLIGQVMPGVPRLVTNLAGLATRDEAPPAQWLAQQEAKELGGVARRSQQRAAVLEASVAAGLLAGAVRQGLLPPGTALPALADLPSRSERQLTLDRWARDAPTGDERLARALVAGRLATFADRYHALVGSAPAGGG